MKNGGKPANTCLHAPDFYAKFIYGLHALSDHVGF